MNQRARPRSGPTVPTAPPLLEARRAGPAPETRGAGASVTYRVVDEGSREKRIGQRARTRLRSGRVFDARNRLLAEALLYDRSATGWRLRIMDDVPLPGCFRFYDDELRQAFDARLVWRRGREIGIVLTP